MKLLKEIASLFSCCLVLSVSPVLADNQVNNYDYIASQVFWDELYPYGGWTLYCGYRFEHDRKTKDAKSVSIEHIYPTARMIEQLHCGSRMQCRKSGDKRFARMEADMHNMYPVWNALVTYRNGFQFGEIPGEDWRFDDCDIEWQGGVLEPRSVARGNIARALLYMYKQYGLKLEPGEIKMLIRWNREDPPSNQEVERNNVIESVQGTRNPFIDNPSLADKLLQH